MAVNTPDNLLKIAADLSKLGSDLAAASQTLSTAATSLEEEAANIALENSRQWGVDVSVAVRAGLYGAGGTNSVVEMKK